MCPLPETPFQSHPEFPTKTNISAKTDRLKSLCELCHTDARRVSLTARVDGILEPILHAVCAPRHAGAIQNDERGVLSVCLLHLLLAADSANAGFIPREAFALVRDVLAAASKCENDSPGTPGSAGQSASIDETPNGSSESSHGTTHLIRPPLPSSGCGRVDWLSTADDGLDELRAAAAKCTAFCCYDNFSTDGTQEGERTANNGGDAHPQREGKELKKKCNTSSLFRKFTKEAHAEQQEEEEGRPASTAPRSCTLRELVWRAEADAR